MTATLKDVALRAGVSRSAVSRAFTPGASVSPKTRARIKAAAEALGYQPNMLARGLSTRTTGLVGLVSNNFHNPAFLEIFDRFTKGLQDRGLRPLLVNLSDETDPARSLRLLRQYSVDGVIVASSMLPPAFSRAFREAGLAVVHAFGRAEPGGAGHSVGIDNRAAGALAAEALIARGYCKIGFLGGPRQATSTEDRLEGFRAGAARAGLGIVESFAGAYSFDAGRIEMQRLLAGPRAEAYFCGDDVLAIGALSAAEDAGLAVPGDLGLIGVNDMEMAGWANINLTTIRQPFAQMIDAAIAMLAALLVNPGLPPEDRRFACEIVTRGTLR